MLCDHRSLDTDDCLDCLASFSYHYKMAWECMRLLLILPKELSLLTLMTPVVLDPDTVLGMSALPQEFGQQHITDLLVT